MFLFTLTVRTLQYFFENEENLPTLIAQNKLSRIAKDWRDWVICHRNLDRSSCLIPVTNCSIFKHGHEQYRIGEIFSNIVHQLNQHVPFLNLLDSQFWIFRCYVECGQEYTQVGPVDDEILLKMRNCSPLVHAHKVKVATMLQVGLNDLRVPPGQSIEYFHRLKANGIKVV